MIFCGIIAEYNPLHNGHLYHLQKAREISGADAVVCAMSGNFTQRGEPALFDKFTRAKAALAAGADIVFELPFLFATQSAEGFAFGGVSLLHAIGANYLCFGSETEDLSLLQKTAALYTEETPGFKAQLKTYLDKGLAFPDARLKAAKEALGLTAAEVHTLARPNAILGVEYLKAIKRLNSPIKPLAIMRQGSGYSETALSGQFSSATAVRKAVKTEGFTESIKDYLPEAVYNVYAKAVKSGFAPVFPEMLQMPILSALRLSTPDTLNALPDAGEGLGSRLFNAAQQHSALDALLEAVKTRRYPATRLNRLLLYTLFGVQAKTLKSLNASGAPYARVLGVRRESERLLSQLAKQSAIPVIARTGGFEHPCFRYDVLSSDIYALTQQAAPYNQAGRDFTERLMKI